MLLLKPLRILELFVLTKKDLGTRIHSSIVSFQSSWLKAETSLTLTEQAGNLFMGEHFQIKTSN